MCNHISLESREVKPGTECKVTEGCKGRKHRVESCSISNNDKLCSETVQLLAPSKWLSLPKKEGRSGRRWCQKRSLNTKWSEAVGSGLTWPSLEAVRLAGCQLAIWDPWKGTCLRIRRLQCMFQFLLLAIVTVEPGKSTLHIFVYP